MRIAFVVHDYIRHLGHSRYVVELATRFRHEHEVHVFANTFDSSAADGITCHHVPAWRRGTLASILSFVLPATLLVRGSFDIVHAQGLCGLRHDVATAHFCQPAWYGAVAAVNGRLGWRSWLARVLVTPLERTALVRARRVIAISERMRADLATHYRRRRGVRVVYHGVDLETFHPRNRECLRNAVRAELNVPPDARLALFVGNLQKGAAAAIRAIALVPGVRLALVSGSNTEAERLVAADAGAADRVMFCELSQQIERYYAAADVFVFPTPYDPYGMVITEAMAAGLPVITNRAAGAAELIEHGRDGWLTDAAWDVEQIAMGLRRLTDDPRLRQVIGAAARAKVEAHTWDRVADETMAVYREVVVERR